MVQQYLVDSDGDISTLTDSPIGISNTGEITFGENGQKVFVPTKNSVEQYDLGFAYDLDSASPSKSLNIGQSNRTIVSVEFNNDGSKLFILRNEDLTASYGDVTVEEYSLQDEYDVGGATLNNTYEPVFSAEPTSIAFDDDGDRLFISQKTFGQVEINDLSTPFDVSTATGRNNIEENIEFFTSLEGVEFNPNGDSMYIAGFDDTLYQYGVSPPFNPEGSDSPGFFTVDDEITNITGLAWTSNGDKVIVSSSSGGQLVQYDVSSNYSLPQDFIDPTPPNSSVTISEDNSIEGVDFGDGGSKFYVVGNENNNLYEYDLATDNDITTLQTPPATFDTSFASGEVYGMEWGDGGNKLYLVDQQNVHELDAGTDYDVTTLSQTNSFFVGATPNPFLRGVDLSSSGDKLLLAQRGVQSPGPQIIAYDLETNFDTTTRVNPRFDVGFASNNPESIEWRKSGTELHVTGESEIGFFDLSTPYDLDTLSNGSDATIRSNNGSRWTESGGSLFLSVGGGIQEFSATADLDPTTLSNRRELDISGQVTSPNDITIDENGEFVFIVEGTVIYVYETQSNFDVGGSSLISSTDLTARFDSVTDIQWSGRGSELWVLGEDSGANVVKKYDVGSLYQPSTRTFDFEFGIGAFISGQNTPDTTGLQKNRKRFYVTDKANNTLGNIDFD
jgi:hypothetical protein